MSISPLDQLYIDTTSKEDMLAEIHDLRRTLADARGEWSNADRELQELRKVKQAYVELKESSKAKDQTIFRLRKASGIKKRVSKREIIDMLESGVSGEDVVIKLGVSKSSINRAKAIIRSGNNESE